MCLGLGQVYIDHPRKFEWQQCSLLECCNFDIKSTYHIGFCPLKETRISASKWKTEYNPKRKK